MNIESLDLVSVIVPFLNGSDWLVEALTSVLQQTYQHWELIVIDDGSSEYHSAIAKDFCSRYPAKILYTEHERHANKGVTISRNEAAKLARGKYLAFLDSDDLWLPQKLDSQLTQFAIHPDAQAVCNAIVMWYSWQNENTRDHLQPVGAPSQICYAPGTLTKRLYPFCEAAPPAPSGLMITKSAFDRIGGFEPAFSGIYELYEDQAFLSKLYLNEPVFISERADVLYRKRKDSMSSAAGNTERYHTVRAFYLDWLESYLCRQNITDREIHGLIEKARSELRFAPHLQDKR